MHTNAALPGAELAWNCCICPPPMAHGVNGVHYYPRQSQTLILCPCRISAIPLRFQPGFQAGVWGWSHIGCLWWCSSSKVGQTGWDCSAFWSFQYHLTFCKPSEAFGSPEIIESQGAILSCAGTDRLMDLRCNQCHSWSSRSLPYGLLTSVPMKSQAQVQWSHMAQISAARPGDRALDET